MKRSERTHIRRIVRLLCSMASLRDGSFTGYTPRETYANAHYALHRLQQEAGALYQAPHVADPLPTLTTAYTFLRDLWEYAPPVTGAWASRGAGLIGAIGQFAHTADALTRDLVAVWGWVVDDFDEASVVHGELDAADL